MLLKQLLLIVLFYLLMTYSAPNIDIRSDTLLLDKIEKEIIRNIIHYYTSNVSSLKMGYIGLQV
jgi:hypothetical protein